MLSACITHLLTQPMWLLLLSSLGFVSFLKASTLLLNWVYATFLRPEKDLKGYGSWALITGATDGIGKAFARQLAQKGLNLILVSRNPNKLRTVSSEILAEHPGTKIKTVVFDFSGKVSTRLVQGVIEKAVEGLDVGLLINNVGITYPAARFFHEVDEKVWMDVVRVNLEGTSRVTRAVLPGMIQRKRGAIVNIGSGASSVMPSHPLFTIYAATKASSLFIPTPEDYAEAAIGRIDYEARCAPYWAHSFQWCFAWLLPECVLDAWRLSIGIHRRGKLIA
ncbi:very-long-chain 3-oxoacyl-CoA reductase-like protein [Populus alba x Populus x berolinensis]|uniref:Very-long-chain 3-oxoacyl-CoA reductase-like protein n=1 Tax=Populus alba x Populus x berolinensis TaxID=444605 RepID=A0AAD6Q8X9_9ROSI|nr:very-long-chain 3-oxoacyl-CoA reductase-like protein [Populus alba x Populus x berolinensis]